MGFVYEVNVRATITIRKNYSIIVEADDADHLAKNVENGFICNNEVLQQIIKEKIENDFDFAGTEKEGNMELVDFDYDEDSLEPVRPIIGNVKVDLNLKKRKRKGKGKGNDEKKINDGKKMKKEEKKKKKKDLEKQPKKKKR
jgi:hypothetical protein